MGAGGSKAQNSKDHHHPFTGVGMDDEPFGFDAAQERRSGGDRRVQRDRRSGSDRREAERRLARRSVSTGRRTGVERRIGERRSGLDRRGW